MSILKISQGKIESVKQQMKSLLKKLGYVKPRVEPRWQQLELSFMRVDRASWKR